MEFVNFSMFATKLLAVFSMAVAMLLAKSEPGILGAGVVVPVSEPGRAMGPGWW
jgi:hypothetical protein